MRNISMIGAVMLSAVAVTPASGQISGTWGKSYAAAPSTHAYPDETLVDGNESDFSPPGPQEIMFTLPDFSKSGFAWTGNQAIRASATAGVNPVITSARFGYSAPPTTLTGWPNDTEWWEATSVISAAGGASYTQKPSQSATTTINLLSDRKLSASFAHDEVLSQQAASTLTGLMFDDVYYSLNGVTASVEARLIIEDTTKNYESITFFQAGTVVYAGYWHEFQGGDSYVDSSAYNYAFIGSNSGGGPWVSQTIYYYNPGPVITRSNEILDSSGNLISYLTNINYSDTTDLSFDYDWIAGRSYQVRLELECLAAIGGMANFIDGNTGSCQADRSLYWNGLTNIRDTNGNPLKGFTLLGEDGFNFVNASPLSPDPANAPPTVPEPGQWAMLIAGFGLVGGAARRRRALVPA